MLAVVSSGATEAAASQDANQEKDTPDIKTAPSRSQTSDAVGESTRAAPFAWPDPPQSPNAALEPIATQVAAAAEAPPTKSIQPTSDASSADAGNATAHTDASTNSPIAVNAAGMSKPVEMFIVATLGLVVAGFLFRTAMKIAGARRRRIIIDQSESHWMDDRNEHEQRDEQQDAESVNQGQEFIGDLVYHPESDWVDHRNEHESADAEQWPGLVHQRAKLIADSQPARVTTATDDTPDRVFRNDAELQEQRRDREPNLADEISKREDTLEQLKRDLDRLLRLPKVA
jgi:hypothetical protein